MLRSRIPVPKRNKGTANETSSTDSIGVPRGRLRYKIQTHSRASLSGKPDNRPPQLQISSPAPSLHGDRRATAASLKGGYPSTTSSRPTSTRRSVQGGQIRLPTNHSELEQFGEAIHNLGSLGDEFSYPEYRSSLLEEYTEAEIQALEAASSFREDVSSLHGHLTNSIRCQENPWTQLKLDMSGLGSQRLQMLLSSCQEGGQEGVWASFVRSNTSSSSERGFLCPTCASGCETQSNVSTGFHFRFDRNRIFEHHGVQALPQALGSCPSMPISNLSSRDRKVICVNLALCIFHLAGSPWLREELDRNTISIWSHCQDDMPQYRPHILCKLKLGSDLVPNLSDLVASLGVLILELTANKVAGWVQDDADYLLGGRKSNIQRLARVLDDKDWKGDIELTYRRIGDACLAFTSMVEDFEHPGIASGTAPLAVLYKCILYPLFECLIHTFGDTTREMFSGLRALKASTQRQSPAQGLVMFDDFDFKGRASGLPQSANKYLKDLKAIAGSISSSGKSKIRIAILDTGVDPTDEKIKYALLRHRIVDRRSWVGGEKDCDDSCGHGTHVARILLDVAPHAELFIAKISNTLEIKYQDMLAIAKAIDWASDECNADIISMSFGFYGEHDEIEKAIKDAAKKDKILIAAASNEGGNKGRSAPASLDNVLCIHACDGKGNDAGISPSPIQGDHNFTVLGVGIKSIWKKAEVFKSGTSFATPIAAGIVANILEFANSPGSTFSAKQRNRLREFGAMRNVLKRLAVIRNQGTLDDNKRDGYDFVNLTSLFWDTMVGNQSKGYHGEVARIIKEVMGQ